MYIPSTLYWDIQIMVKNAYFCVVKTKCNSFLHHLQVDCAVGDDFESFPEPYRLCSMSAYMSQ